MVSKRSQSKVNDLENLISEATASSPALGVLFLICGSCHLELDDDDEDGDDFRIKIQI